MENDKKKAENKKKSNNWAISLLIVFGLMAFYWLGYAVTTDNTKPIGETKPSETLVSKKAFWKESFMKGCNPSGNQTSGCLCVWDKMDAKWTDEELASIFIEYGKTEKLPEAFSGFVSECIET